MRCEPGDLAVIVRSYAGNTGKVLTCIRLATNEDLEKEKFKFNAGPVWVIDIFLKREFLGKCALVPDSQLRPLRDNPGQDETLTWAP